MKLLLALLVLTLATNCGTTRVQRPVSSCIQNYIEANKGNWQVGSVEEYEFQGKLVYAFTPSSNIKDGTTLIKSADCKDMCNIGGYAGPRNSNCNGDNFFEKALFKRKIWPAE